MNLLNCAKNIEHLNFYHLDKILIEILFMKKQLQKDIKIRKFFKKLELTSCILKSMVKNESFSLLLKWNAIKKLSSLPINSNKTRFVNRCVITRRKAKFNKIFKKFSRLSFLRLVRSGYVVGLKKSSW